MTDGICLIVAHDAGGAEILSSYVNQNQDQKYRFVLAGPAIAIFQKKVRGIELSTLEKALSEASWCLCGTSWQSDIEWLAIKQAKINGLRVIAFIDHWVNYAERFIRGGVKVLPNELWVADEYAKQIAQKIFPQLSITIVENPYLIDIKHEIDDIRSSRYEVRSRKSSTKVLFVSENLSGHALLKYGDKNHFGYTEFDAIDFLLNNLDQIDTSIKEIAIRPHPSDKKGKYDVFVEQFPKLIQISQGTSLLQDVIEADIVTGCQSMALVVALVAEKKVFSCIPIKQKCSLPHDAILNLQKRIL